MICGIAYLEAIMQLDDRAIQFLTSAKQAGKSKEEAFAFLQSKGYDLGEQPQQPQATQEQSTPKRQYTPLEKATYTLRGAGEGIGLQLGDIVGGVTNTVSAPLGKVVGTFTGGAPLTLQDFNPLQNFKQGRKDFVREQEQFADTHPWLNALGEFGGAAVTGMLGAGKKLATAAGKQGLKALTKQGTKEGFKWGGAYTAGAAATKDPNKISVKDALIEGPIGAGTGAVLGAALPVATVGATRGAQQFFGTKGYAKRAADKIFQKAGSKKIDDIVRTTEGTRALKEAIKADDAVAEQVRNVADKAIINGAEKTQRTVEKTLGVGDIVRARDNAKTAYNDLIKQSEVKIPQEMYKNRAIQEALAQAKKNDYLGEIAQYGDDSLFAAQRTKENLDDMIEASFEKGDFGKKVATDKTRQLMKIKDQFVKGLDQLEPAYKGIRKNFEDSTQAYNLLEELTKARGGERSNTINQILTNKNKWLISKIYGKEKADSLFNALRDQKVETDRFSKLYNAAENKLTKEQAKSQGLVREALESFGSIVGNAIDTARLGGATRGRRRIGEILLGMNKETKTPGFTSSIANKLKEEGGYAMKPLNGGVKQAIDSLGAEETKNVEKLLKPRNLVAENFVSDVNNILKDGSVNNFQKIDMGQIPWVYIANGLEEQPLQTNKLAIKKAMGLLTPEELKAHPEWHNHNVPKEVIDKMPELIADPLAIFKSNTEKGKYVAVLDAKVKGDPVVAIISPGKKGGYTFMPTSYEKESFADFVKNTQKANNVLYVDTKRSSSPHTLLQAVSVGNDDPTYSIATKDGIVKRYFDNLKKFSNKSQIIDEKGNPIVMYHNTTAEPFDTFDVNKIGSSGSGAYHGAGFNFASSPLSVYGKNEMPVYLNAKNVLSSDKKTITRGQLKKMFLAADKGRKDTLVGDFSYQYAPYGSQEYSRSIDKAVDNLFSNAESDLDIYSNFTMGSSLSHKETMNLFKKLGYDGAVEKRNGKVSVAVVFDPTQIKSVYNKGTFDKKNPNIYKALIGGIGISQILRNKGEQNGIRQ